MGKAAILLVEDEQIVALDIQQRLTRLGYTVTGIAISGEEAVRMATDTRPHIILMDIHLRGDTDGIEAAEEIRSSMSVPIIYLTAYTDDQTLERAKITDPFGYLIKPFEERELYITIEMALYRHSLERQLQDSEERYRQLFQQNENAIILFDSVSSHVIDVNPSVERLFGYPAHILMDQGLEAILTGNAWPQLTSCFGAGADESFRLEEINARHRDGHSLTLAIHGQKIHLTQGHQIYCFLYDITEKIRLQKEKEQIRNRLIHANKMTALGTMSSGIAHEINNPNNFIVFNAQLLADAWKDALPILETYRQENGEFPLAGLPFTEMQDAIPELIQGINEGSERIKNIVDRMKHFARQENFRLDDRFDLNQVVQNALTMINNQIRLFTNHFHTRMAETLPLIPGNAQMIEQVIINLVMNALQALTHRQQAVELTTTLDNRNQWVILTITDEGSGMSADVLSRITEPFFTTRQDSGGTGLGLSISYSIIDEHGGTLEFTSTPGRGTTAILCLPTGDTPRAYHPDIPFETERTTDKDNSPAPEC